MVASTPPSQDAEVIVILRLQFRPGTIENVLALILPIAQMTREEPGNIAFDIFRALDDENRLHILERWRDKSALEQHWKQSYTRKALTVFDEHLERPLSETDDVTYLQDVLD